MSKPEKCVMHLSTVQPVALAQTILTIAPILVEGCISFTKEGMFIKGVNNIILCDMEITDVDEYCCVEDTQVYVNLNALCGCLSAVTQDEIVVFQITKDSMSASTPYLAVFIANRNDGYVFSFAVPQLALEYSDFEVPTTNFAHVISIPSNQFQRVLRTCSRSARGDYVQICTRNQGPDETYIVFNTVGDDSSMMFYMRYQIAENEWKEGSCDKQDLYSLKYLMLIAKGAPVSNCVTLYLAPEFVLAIAYNIGTIGKITFCLAPRMETTDFLPPHITPLDSIIPSIDSDLQMDGMNLLEYAADEGDDAEEGMAQTELLNDDGAPLPKKKKSRKKQQSSSSSSSGGGLVADNADISSVRIGGSGKQKAQAQKKKTKPKAKKEGSIGLRMASKEEEKASKKKRKALMDTEPDEDGMRMHDDGSKIKRQRRKKAQPESIKVTGVGSIEDAFIRSGQKGVAETLHMSATNMAGIESGSDINEALMLGAKKEKEERKSGKSGKSEAAPPPELEDVLELPEEL